MIDSRSRQVMFAYVGSLPTRGRLLKQIATLQEAGLQCGVVLGNPDPEEPDPEAFSFPFQCIPVEQSRGRLTSFLQQLKFCRKAADRIVDSGADTVVCLALESLMAGVWAKKRKPSLRLIFDNNELHLESYGAGLKTRIWKPIHNRAIRRCDVILHAEENRMMYFKEHYDSGSAVQRVLENFPFFREQAPKRPEPAGNTRVIYLGGYGDEQFTLEIIEAFAAMDASVKLDIVGSGRPEFVARAKERLKELAVGHIRLLPAVPYPEIPELLESYHIGVSLYRNTNLNNYYCAPNKLYDYLMSGLPVITNRYPGLVKVIETNRVGACLEQVNADEIPKAVDSIVRERRWENITDELRRRYCWEQQVPDFLGVFGIAAGENAEA